MAWNDIDFSVRNLESVISFKYALFRIFDVPHYKRLFNFSLDRYSSIIHTRLRLNVCALNYYLFKIGVNPLPNVCVVLKLKVLIIIFFTVRCLLLLCRLKLLSSAAHILADRWNAISELQLLRLFLTESSQLIEK